VDTGDTVSEIDRVRAEQSDVEVVHDLEQVGYLVLKGPESDVENIGDDYHVDIELNPEATSEVRDINGLDDDKDISSEEGRDYTVPESQSDLTGDLPFPDAFAWDKDVLDLETAHETNTGQKPNGDPVRVGIIDDGVYDHPDLNVDKAASVDLTGDGQDVLHPNEYHYHGTHVAGITAGQKTGVAPDAEIVSLRYFSNDSNGNPTGFFGNFIAGINEAIAANCDVVNASLGFTSDQPESRAYLIDYIQNRIEDLANLADEAGLVWVASAGNSGNNADNLVPGSAKAEDVISAAATGPTGIVRPDSQGGRIENDPIQPPKTPASYTTHGEDYVDVSAPGGSWDVYPGSLASIRDFIAPDAVLSTLPTDTVDANLNYSPDSKPLPAYTVPDATGSTDYGFLQGTSMAAPQVTGLVALLQAENPGWTAHEIRQVLTATSQDLGDETYHGHGFIDPVAALNVDDPAEVRDDLENPDSDSRNDRGRNEANDGSPRNGGSGSSSDRDKSRDDDDSEDDEDDDGGRGRSR
jgi:subtilisin family serine protease